MSGDIIRPEGERGQQVSRVKLRPSKGHQPSRYRTACPKKTIKETKLLLHEKLQAPEILCRVVGLSFFTISCPREHLKEEGPTY